MFKQKNLAWLVAATGWLSSVLPAPWAAVIASLGSVSLLALTQGASVLVNPKVLGFAFLTLIVFWTYIGLVWLVSRRSENTRYLRYGLTFEGIMPMFTPYNNEGALAFALSLRNYSPLPIRYKIEDLDIRLETRTLPTKYLRNSLQGFLPRGAGKASTAIPFRVEHIREFLGKRVDGTIDFTIVYGDADKEPVRRLKMAHSIAVELPSIQPDLLIKGETASPQMPFGFAAIIMSESDEPI